MFYRRPLQSSSSSSRYVAYVGWDYSQKELTEQHRFELLRDSHHTSSLFHVNLLQEYLPLCGDGLVYSDPEQDRINVPGSVSDFNWTYRLRPSVEQMATNKQLRDRMVKLIMDM